MLFDNRATPKVRCGLLKYLCRISVSSVKEGRGIQHILGGK